MSYQGIPLRMLSHPWECRYCGVVFPWKKGEKEAARAGGKPGVSHPARRHDQHVRICPSRRWRSHGSPR